MLPSGINEIAEYKIIMSTNNEEMEAGIQRCINNGYQPYGELHFIKFQGTFYFIQVMVTYA